MPRNGAGTVGQRVIVGGVFRGGTEGDGAQGGLVLGLGGGATEGQHSCGGVVAAGDAVLVGEAQLVARNETGGDGDCGPGEIGIIHICQVDSGVHDCGHTVLGVREDRTRSGDWTVVHRGDDYRGGGAGSECAAAACIAKITDAGGEDARAIAVIAGV